MVIDKNELLAVFSGLGLQIGNDELASMFQAADSCEKPWWWLVGIRELGMGRKKGITHGK